jgi:hypothetical protein
MCITLEIVAGSFVVQRELVGLHISLGQNLLDGFLMTLGARATNGSTSGHCLSTLVTMGVGSYGSAVARCWA